MPTRKPEFQATVTCNRAVFARLDATQSAGRVVLSVPPRILRATIGDAVFSTAAAAGGDKKKPADAVRGLLSCLLADCGAPRANTN